MQADAPSLSSLSFVVTAFVSVLISPYAADILYAIRIRRKGRGLPLCKGMSDIGPGLRISIVEGCFGLVCDLSARNGTSI